MKNKYIYRSRISEAKFREIIKFFSLDIEAIKIAKLTHISRPSINKILKGVRERIASYCEKQTPLLTGEIEMDESYFGARRVRGIRGRGAQGKTIVFGLIKRKGKVYTRVVSNVKSSSLMPIIQDKIDKDSTLYTNGFRSYDGLVDYGYKHHYRVNHGQNEFVRGYSHINGIENFWGITKTRLSKFRGISKSTFYLHLKESEFRFNCRDHNIYSLLLKIIRNHPLNLS